MKKLFLSVPAAFNLAALLLASTSHAAITVIDYYRLGDADPGAANGAVVNATSQDSVGGKHLTRIGSPTYTNAVSPEAAGRTGSLLAVNFNGSGQGLSNAVLSTVTDNFGVEVWARSFTNNGNHSIAYNGNTGSSGWGIYQLGANYGVLFGGVNSFNPSPVVVGAWTHLALVRAGGTTTLYVNGIAAGTSPFAPNVPIGGFCIALPGQGGGTENFNGQIDEVRVFTFATGQFSTTNLLINAPYPIGSVRKTSALLTDTDANSKTNPGDVLRYMLTLTNAFGSNLLNAILTDTNFPNQTFVGGSLTATPLGRADAPATNSAPGGAFHGVLNTTLNIPAGSGLLANDFPGVPAATISGFGAGTFGGQVQDHAPGTSANAPGVGTLTVNADGSLSFVPAANFNGTLNFLYRLANTVGASDVLATLAIGVRPGATNDSFNVTGNTMLDSSLVPTNLLANDAGSVIGVFGNTAPAHGTVSINIATGNFIYTPAAAYSGADSFTYTITNGFGSSVGTVNLTIANKIWYIDNSVVANGDGRSSSPFKQTSDFTAVNDGAAGHPADTDRVFLRQGTGNYTGGTTLRSGQRLIGDGAVGTFATHFGFSLAPGSARAAGVAVPAITGTRPFISVASGTGVTLNTDNWVQGLNVNSASGRAVSGASVGFLILSNVTASATGDRVLNIVSGSVIARFDSASSTNSVDNGIALSALGGSVLINGGFITGAASTDFVLGGSAASVTFAGGINNAAGRSVDISGQLGGTVTLSGNITDTATGLIVQNCTGGTITFSGGIKVFNTGGSPAITLNTNNGATINFSGNGGLDVDTTSATAFSVTGGGTVNVTGAGNTINSTSGTTFLNSGTGGSAVIDINAPLTGTGRLIDIQNRTSGNVTLSANLTNSGGTGMLIQNNSGGGTINLSGTTKTFNTGANTAVNLVNNTGTTINFTPGSLSITTTTGTGFNATGGGTVSVVGTGNIISSGNGSGLNVANTTIGASGLTFQSISSSGGSATGIILDNTGASGGLTVTGTGGVGSGGTIANKTGADGSTTTGVGIYLNNTANISFSRMQLNGLQNFGIRGFNVNNFIFNDSVINGINGSTGGAFDEAAISFNNLLGSASLSRCNIAHGFEYVVKILNNSGSLNRLMVETTTFGANDTALGGDALQIVASQTSTINMTVTNCTFTNAREDLFNAAVTQTANMDLVFRNNNLGNNHANKVSAASNFLLFSTSTGAVTYDVTRNTLTTGATGSALAVAKGVPDSGSGGTMTGTVKANTIGLSGVVGSGSQFTGIFASALGSGTHTTLIDSNIIYHYNEEGIFLKANDPLTGGNSVLNATLTANQTLQPDSFAFAGLWIVAGSGSGTESQVVNVLLGNSSTASLQNDFTAGDPANGSDVFFQESGSSSAINLSRAGSVSGTVALVVADDNVGTPTVVSAGTVNLVNTTPALPPPVAP